MHVHVFGVRVLHSVVFMFITSGTRLTGFAQFDVSYQLCYRLYSLVVAVQCGLVPEFRVDGH